MFARNTQYKAPRFSSDSLSTKFHRLFKQLNEKQKAQNEPREIARRLANVRF